MLGVHGLKNPIHLPRLRAFDSASIRHRHASRGYRFESIEKWSVFILRLGDDSRTYSIDADTSGHIHRRATNKDVNRRIDQRNRRAPHELLVVAELR